MNETRRTRWLEAACSVLHADDIGWLLEHPPGEVVIVRPVGDDRLGARQRLTPGRGAVADA